MINLKLTVDEVNLILRCVGKQPAESVRALLNNLEAQAKQQVDESGKPIENKKDK